MSFALCKYKLSCGCGRVNTFLVQPHRARSPSYATLASTVPSFRLPQTRARSENVLGAPALQQLENGRFEDPAAVFPWTRTMLEVWGATASRDLAPSCLDLGTLAVLFQRIRSDQEAPFSDERPEPFPSAARPDDRFRRLTREWK